MKKVLTGRKLFDIIKKSLRCLKKKKLFEKKLKKFLTNSKVCDIISKLSQRQQQRTLITEQ